MKTTSADLKIWEKKTASNRTQLKHYKVMKYVFQIMRILKLKQMRNSFQKPSTTVKKRS